MAFIALLSAGTCCMGQPWYNNYSFGFASTVGTALQYEQCANDGARNLMQKLCSFKAKPLANTKKSKTFYELHA